MVAKSPFPDVEIPVDVFHRYITEFFPRYASRPALIDGADGRVVTYDELRLEIIQVAAGLHKHGLQKGDKVAIYSSNHPEYASLFLAVALLGGVNTTINPIYTVDELSFQLKDAGARFLFTIPQMLDKAQQASEEAGIEKLFVFGEGEGALSFASLKDHGEYVPEVEIDPKEDLLVLPYSSGTTGLPKGVMLTHHNLVANIAQTESVEPLDDGEVLIGILPFYHIYGMTVIMSMALRKGATVVTMPRFDMEHFLQLMQDYKVTSAYLVPPIILGLAKHPIVDKYDLSSLGYITSGAAPLSPAVSEECATRLDCVVKQGYGLTETSPVTHFTPRQGPIKLKAVGVSIPNTETLIADVETGKMLPIGEVGEIWMRGPQVMKGYHQNPEATNAMIDAEGWLHTGDVGYLDEDSYLYVIDRVKELIKYKGLQVAPAELEAVLLGHPAIADAAVIPSPDEEAGEVPKGCIVLKPGVEVTAEEIQAFVAERVAPYKKLRRVEFMPSIPKVPSGKILRRELVKREREMLGE
ncbi:MAG: 4-coumarate--CoA ligase family protein [Bacteroidota bacterium]